ncbi:MAG TPA: response regulator transcription factor [Candidatus Coproplasma excrementigallinarum]|uniref:Stage 0 sporulation protein A homolog n=1 Tax=Candidatus Coproplasma excrementigallinarum TaxID=2840747 RepID=A0A9D1MKG9_9FIRM|nr:response regulator transcription factor [Candidatus Coproplasma excrementigallinarum]
MIRVMLADDQKILAEGIKSVLQTSPEIEVCGIAYNGVQAVDMAKELHPDVILMDVRMPEMNGVAATKRIKEASPDIKIIILTTFDDSDYILSGINNGASGYLLKDIGSTALIDAIKNAYAGDTILPSKIAKKITDAAMLVSSDKQIKLKKAYGLSDREVDIAMMLSDGFTNRQIASALKLSDGTARNYISSIYLKLGVDSRMSAISKIKELS